MQRRWQQTTEKKGRSETFVPSTGVSPELVTIGDTKYLRWRGTFRKVSEHLGNSIEAQLDRVARVERVRHFLMGVCLVVAAILAGWMLTGCGEQGLSEPIRNIRTMQDLAAHDHTPWIPTRDTITVRP